MQLMDLFNNLSICLSETDAKALLKERQKKDNHNLSKSVQIMSTSLAVQICPSVTFFLMDFSAFNRPT